MIDDPCSLISKIDNSSVNSNALPDAIYIPHRYREESLKRILSSLYHFHIPTYVLTSPEFNTSLNRYPGEIKILPYKKMPEYGLISKFHQKKKKTFPQKTDHWDLPIKRNLALMHSRTHGYNSILLLDNDIINIKEEHIHQGTHLLENYNISGPLISSFPDTSILGHIERNYNEPYNPFMSGSFLFINTSNIEGFFPQIYNEDWLFLLPQLMTQRVTYLNEYAQQESYDPLDKLSTIQLQEFGDTYVEGLYYLIKIREYEQRYKHSFWKEYIAERREYLRLLLKNVITRNEKIFLNESIRINCKIKADHCISFTNQWENDIIEFKKILK